MKKIDYTFRGTRGSIPPQLFKYINRADMAGETIRFTEYINTIVKDFLAQIENNRLAPISDIKLTAPQKLFNRDVTLDYVGSGTIGSVYKINIGDEVFALKINYIPRVNADLVAMSEHKYVRNLMNRPYIAMAFRDGRIDHSWILSDYVEADYENSYVVAKEKLFYAALTKGIKYSDMYPANTKNGKIIDIAGVTRFAPNLTRVEIDLVKKFLHFMRTDDVAAVRRLADDALVCHGNVINYLFVKMHLYQMEMPMRLQKFKKIITEYNTRLRIMREGVTRQK